MTGEAENDGASEMGRFALLLLSSDCPLRKRLSKETLLASLREVLVDGMDAVSSVPPPADLGL